MPAISYKKARRMIKSSIAASARWDIEAEEDGEIERALVFAFFISNFN